MADIPLPEDEAARYVLGEMEPDERCRFEARLEKSDELRRLVRELEAATVAAALALPQREPPGSMWSRIESVVTLERQRKVTTPGFWRAVRMQSGWWAAAACLIGWMLYALWINHIESPMNRVGLLSVPSQTNSRIGAVSVEPSRVELLRTVPSPLTASNAFGVLPPMSTLARTGEIAALRRQVQDLETQVTQMSRMITQQQAVLPESTQFTFLQLVPSGSGAGSARVASPSPELQRALFLAMARELGWLRAQDGVPGPGGESKDGAFDPATTVPGVDFVFLSSPGGTALHHTTEDSTGSTNILHSGASAGDDTVLPGGIPVLLVGNNVSMAIDPSVVPVGSSLAFWNGTQLVGTTTVGNGLMVVSFSTSGLSGGALNFGVTSGAGGATSNTVFVQPAPAPRESN